MRERYFLLQLGYNGSRFQVPMHLFHVLGKEKYRWEWIHVVQAISEQWNSGIAIPRPQACAQIKLVCALVKFFVHV